MTEGDAWLLLVAGRSYDGVLRYLWNDSGRQLPAHCFRAEPTGCGDWAAMWAPDPVVTANFGSCDPVAWKMDFAPATGLLTRASFVESRD
jgi:hypothetical protein